MGLRVRLRNSFDITGFSAQAQVILQALKTYGAALADNGSAWYLSGAPNENWDNDVLHEMDVVTGSDFEAVDTSVLMIDPNSGQCRSWPPPPIFLDDFEDNDITDWTPTLGTWLASGGNMTGTSKKAADIFPDDFAAGCSNCIIEADLQIIGTGSVVSLLGWRLNSSNYVELQIDDKKNKITLTKYSSTSKKVKSSAKVTVSPGVNYHARMRYTSGMVVAEVTGLSGPLTVNASSIGTGAVGFRVKSPKSVPVGGSFAGVTVY
jgi:hypothetical protein